MAGSPSRTACTRIHSFNMTKTSNPEPMPSIEDVMWLELEVRAHIDYCLSDLISHLLIHMHTFAYKCRDLFGRFDCYAPHAVHAFSSSTIFFSLAFWWCLILQLTTSLNSVYTLVRHINAHTHPHIWWIFSLIRLPLVISFSIFFFLPAFRCRNTEKISMIIIVIIFYIIFKNLFIFIKGS